MAKTKVRRFDNGGETDEAADKAAGLEASKGEDVGFFERLRMGNIDDPSSEAYRRFGAGRGRAERAAKVPVEEAKVIPVAQIRAQAAQDEMRKRAEEEGAKEDGDARVAEKYQGARSVTSEPETPKVSKSSSETGAGAGRGRQGGPTADEQEAYRKKDKGTFSGRGGQGGPTAEELKAYRQKQYEEADAAAKTPEGQRKLKEQAEKEAIQRVYPEEYLIGGPGLKGVAAAAKKLATPKLRTIEQAALPPPQKLLTGPSKAELLARDRAARAAANREEMLRENARRYGLDPKSERFKETSEAVRRSLGGDEFSVLKKGGKVKSYKAGGMVSSASRRGDGIAQRGKTRGKYI
jgi:hypothetical protein